MMLLNSRMLLYCDRMSSLSSCSIPVIAGDSSTFDARYFSSEAALLLSSKAMGDISSISARRDILSLFIFLM